MLLSIMAIFHLLLYPKEFDAKLEHIAPIYMQRYDATKIVLELTIRFTNNTHNGVCARWIFAQVAEVANETLFQTSPFLMINLK